MITMHPADRAYRRVSDDILAIAKSRPLFIIPTASVLFLVLGTGPNYQFALLTCAVLVAGTFLLWRPGEAQILLFLFLFQWLQPTVTVFYANLRDMTLVEFMGDFPGIEFAIVLVLLGLTFLALGIRLGAGKQQAIQIVRFHDTIQRIPPTYWLRLHLVALAVSTATLQLAQALPGLSQPLLALANLKWATFLIFTISTFARRDGPRIRWLAIFCIEFAMSLGGYFSSFKSVFLYTLIAITAIGLRLTAKQVVSGAITAAVMLVAGLYWTAIKVDYRRFVSGGSYQQVVEASKGEAVLKIVELVSEVTSDQLLRSADKLAHRFSEIDVFSAVTTYVPSVVPHEWGTLWLDAISRPFMPRILFPNKAVIDESELTNRYSSVAYAGREQGTQVSMGYIADSYIDFGEFGMMVIILLFGYFIGTTFRWLANHVVGSGLLGAALASATFIQLTSIGNSSAKLVGGIVVSLVVAGIILYLVAPRYLRWLDLG
jgi:hypothetical protein